MAHVPIDIPPFLDLELLSGDSYEVIRDRIQSKKWLSTALENEIIALYPKIADVNPSTGERDKDRFAENCLLLFPKGRIFASEKQIEQAADMFMDAWACRKAHDGKKIMCHYGQSSRKKKISIVDPLSQREQPETQKEKCNCPFKIMYSHQGKRALVKKPGIFYCAKITTVDPIHTCGMCPRDMRIAAQRTGYLELNLEGMKDILSLLSAKPRVSCQVLRPMVEKYLPNWTGIPAQYIINFRQRVLLFLIKNPNYEHMTYEQAISLTSKKVMSANEMTELDDPFVHQNFTAMLRKIMQEDAGTWEALGLMDQLKVSSPGFDYRIKKDLSGLPTGLMYMTAQMRTHARRYGSVLCLDAQKRQYNSSGWPYIAPVVKDNEMKVAVAAESIVTEETHEYYVWILQCMVEIEPRFQLCNVRIIFADQKITPTVLQELGIESTCTLRGDFYHLLHEVWPNHFHSSVYPQIQKFLRSMLLSSNLTEWDSAYVCASKILIEKPLMLSALNDIYGDPEKYGGFYLRGIEGNLMMNGDVLAEQNHSGVVAYLGDGACFAVAEQITHLLSQQKNIDKMRRQKEDDQYVHGLRFQSPYYGPQQQADDAVAKKNFSAYGFVSLWTPTIRRSWNLQAERLEDGSSVLWSTKETREERSNDSSTIILEGSRCTCQRRIAMQIQCEHEYVLDGGIDIYKFDSHWYHRQTYDRMFPNMASVFPPTQFGQETMGQPDDGEDYPENDNGADNDATSGMPETNNGIIETSVQDNHNRNEDETGNPDNSTPLMPCTSQIVTYQHIQERSSELARTCQNDQPKMRTILSNLNQMIERVRDGHDIFINFDSSYVNMELDTANTNTNIPQSAITKSIPNATGVKRMRSGREYFSRNKKKHRKNIFCS